MAERKSSARQKRGGSTPRKQPKGQSPAQEADRLEAEEASESELDNPLLPDQPDELRHAIYFGGVVLGGLALNFLLLVLISGGR